jgi:tryptophan halogenase
MGMPHASRRSVVIVGGGTAGWMAAAAIARFAPRGTSIQLVESDAIGTVGVGEATIPQLRLFNASLGIDEDRFVRETGGTFKLGIRFEGWSGDASRYIHAFGTLGRSWGLVPFHHYWLRAAQAGEASSLWDYSASARAASEGRFARDPGRPELPSGIAWAFHFDAGMYAAFLRRHAEAAGVVRHEGRVVAVARAEDGDIAGVTLDDGREIAGDLFVDCSGFRGLLIEETLDAGYDDWSRYLPCDRALAVPSEATRPLAPFTRAIAREAGWQWRIPLQHRTGNGLVYASEHLSDDRAAALLLANLDAEPLADPRPLCFVTGKRRRAWVGNCVALGLAAGFMEPLESTSIHLIQSGVARLLEYWPGGRIAEADVAEYNRRTDAEWLAIRDFLVLHYHANARAEPFWRARREAAIPDTLAERIALFRENGRVRHDPDSLFTEVGWLQVMIGQGIVPAGHHALADGPAPAELAEFLSLASRHAAQVAGRMPPHDVYLAAHCAAPSPQPKAA